MATLNAPIELKARTPDELQKKNKYVASKFIAAAAAAQDTDDAPHEVNRNQWITLLLQLRSLRKFHRLQKLA